MNDPCRVLVVHAAYQQRGGEDSVVDSEIRLLQRYGHEVRLYSRHNNDIEQMPKLTAAAQSIWSTRTTRDLQIEIAKFSPNVIHVHNTFPLISPSLYWATPPGIPVIQTLHNFRLLCPQAMFLREGKICEACLGKVPWRAVIHHCYRGSTAQSTVAAGMLVVHRRIGTWQRRVTRYIALNDFCRRKFIEGGIDLSRISIKPNFVEVDQGLGAGERRGFLFVGRLSEEKGVAILAKAALMVPNVQISVLGAGPLEHLLHDCPNVRLRGYADQATVLSAMKNSVALLMPSVWYENFPRTIVEAYACGLPAIGSRLGALAELIHDGKTGILFESGSAADLASKLQWAAENVAAMVTMGANARNEYEANYTAEINYQQLISIYEIALAESKSNAA